MTTYLGKSCSFGLPLVPFVNCHQYMYLVISLLVLRAGCGIWLYQLLIIFLLSVTEFSASSLCAYEERGGSDWKRLKKSQFLKRQNFYEFLKTTDQVNSILQPKLSTHFAHLHWLGTLSVLVHKFGISVFMRNKIIHETVTKSLNWWFRGNSSEKNEIFGLVVLATELYKEMHW